MSNKIQIKRGLKGNLPILDAGEPAFTTDTKEFFIGDGSTNIEFAKQADLEIANTQLLDMIYETAGGTATALTVPMKNLVNGYSKTFIASVSNGGTATTVNGKKLFKPGTKISPNLIQGKAYTIWYDSTGDCFFIKASAEGDAIAANVLAGKKFSNDDDTGIIGTMPSKAAATITPGIKNQIIGAEQYLAGAQTIIGDPNLISNNIRANKSIFGVQGKTSVVDTEDATVTSGQMLLNATAYKNGGKITGSIIDRSAENWHQPTAAETVSDVNGHGAYVIPPAGYYNGSSWVRSLQPYLYPQYIVSGANIFGVQGNASINSLGGYIKTSINCSPNDIVIRTNGIGPVDSTFKKVFKLDNIKYIMFSVQGITGCVNLVNNIITMNDYSDHYEFEISNYNGYNILELSKYGTLVRYSENDKTLTVYTRHTTKLPTLYIDIISA